MTSRATSFTLAILVLFIAATIAIPAAYAQVEDSFGEQKGAPTITAVPRSMAYQGILKDSAGDPVADSIYDVTFRIYEFETGGTDEWSSTIPCTTAGGLFNASLAAVNLPFDVDYWLELEVDSEVLAPRSKLSMSAYAARADSSDHSGDADLLDGFDSADFSPSGHGHPSPDTVNFAFKSDSSGFAVYSLLSDISIYSDSTDAISDGAVDFADIGQNSATSGQVMKWNGSAWGAADDDAGSSSGWTDDGTVLRLDTSSDSVGIGTTTPSEKLEVSGNIKASGTITAGNSITIDGVNDKITASSGTIDFDDENIVTNGKATLGPNNTNSGTYSFVAGRNNTASALYSVVGGGGGALAANGNSATNNYTVVSGGTDNTASGNSSVVGGGGNNTAAGHNSVVSGGYYNISSGYRSTISGGGHNRAAGDYSTISGGGGFTSVDSNSATGNYSTVSGGRGNVAGDYYATISGGYFNLADVTHGTIGGGSSNIVSGLAGTVSGGQNNTASAYSSIVGGGQNNTASNSWASVGGGYNNTASGDRASVGGGEGNTASNNYASVGGGRINSASGNHSTIAGGHNNSVESNYSAILGGYADTIASTAHYSYLFGIKSKLTADSTFMVDMPHIRFGDEANGYELPASDGTADQMMATNGNGQVSWTTLSGGWADDGTVVRLEAISDSVGIGTTTPTEKLDIDGNIKVSGKAAIGLQNSNTGYLAFVAGYRDTASGDYSTVSGGRDNTASNSWASLGGGWRNTASGSYASLGGGRDNTASNSYSSVGGGYNNSASGINASVGGGYNNTANGYSASVGGGDNNTASGFVAFVGGGNNNTASNQGATVGGGYFNKARGDYSVVAGGGGITAADSNSASGYWATVSGGRSNVASGTYASIGGGIDNMVSYSFSTIGGGKNNIVSGSSATVSGGEHNFTGGMFSTVGGGYYDSASAYSSTVGGGWNNNANDTAATVGGGRFNYARGKYSVVAGGGGGTNADSNSASGDYSAIGGGSNNTVSGDMSTIAGGESNYASGYGGTVGGGRYNTASGDYYSVVPGGYLNVAGGRFSFAAGNRAKANHIGSIVISANSAGLSTDSIRSGGNEQMVLRADGGLYITNTGELAPYDATNIITTRGGAYLSGNGTNWTNSSDRNKKENFAPINRADLLDKISELPISEWNYKEDDESVRHIGPVAQDFHKIFGVGNDNKSISTIDPSGIALAGIQELIRQNNELIITISEMKTEIDKLKNRIR